MIEKLKTFLEITFAILILLLALPFFLAWLLFIAAPVAAWEYLFKRIRKDPRVKFERMKASEPEITDETDKYARQYFRELAESISSMSGSSLKELPVKRGEWANIPNGESKYRVINYSIELSSAHVNLQLSLDIEEHSEDGHKRFYSVTDGDDGPMAGYVYIKAVKPALSMLKDCSIGYDHEMAWVVVALLRGDFKVSALTSQLWCFIKEKNIWLVQYKKNSNLFGQREAYSEGRARRMWVDSRKV